jgi:hypothetical protein
LYDQTVEVFEFSDLILEPTLLTPESNNIGINNINAGNDNRTTDESQTTKDRYDALRNIDVNDNDSFSIQKSQNIILQPTNPFAANVLGNTNSEPTTQAEQNDDKYAAISEAITISEQTEGGSGVAGSLKWSRSVMGQGEYGWSDQVLNGGESC